jgi:hypothetical protein
MDMPLGEKLYPVRRDALWGYIDAHGNLAIRHRFEYASLFSEGLAHVLSSGEDSFIDARGQEAIRLPTPWGGAWISTGFSKGIAPIDFISTGTVRYLRRDGTPLTSVCFANGEAFCNGVAVVKVGNREGLLASEGNLVCEPQFRRLLSFRPGEPVSPFLTDESCGLLDMSGRRTLELPGDWGEIRPFSEGLFAVCPRGGRFRFLDASGQCAFGTDYWEVTMFVEGKAVVCAEYEECALVGRDGRPLTGFGFRELCTCEGGRIIFRKGNETSAGGTPNHGRYGILDASCREIVPPRFDYLHPFGGELAQYEEGDFENGEAAFGYVDRSGRIVWPAER